MSDLGKSSDTHLTGTTAEEVWDAATRAVSDELRSAIDAYVGDGFQKINGYLDHGDPPEDLDEVLALIHRLDTVFNAQAPTSCGTVLYRSERRGRMTDRWLDADVGEVVRPRRYCSTTTRRHVTEGLYAGPIRLVILAPWGVKGINVRRLSSHPASADEFEVILPRHSGFRILAREKVEDVDYMRVEWVSWPWT